MNQRSRLALLMAHLLCACGQVSTLGKGVDSENNAGEASVGGYASSVGGHANTVAGDTSSVGGDMSAVGGYSGGTPAEAGTGGQAASVIGSGKCTSRGSTCRNNQLYRCAGVGEYPSFVKACTVAEACNADASSCVLTVGCNPGAERCIGSQVARCNASGKDWLQPTDCAQGETCSNDRCEKGCEPLSWYCQGNNAYQCNANGVAAVYQSCDQKTERCLTKEDSSYAYCAEGCKPGARLCVPGTNASGAFATCNADGSKPTSGTPCGKDEFCKEGACVPSGCVGELSCRGSELYACNVDTPLACPTEHACLDLVVGSRYFGAGCAALPCSPGTSACVRNQVGTCAPDGNSLTQVTDDCMADGSVCSADPQCAKAVTDTLGVADNNEVEFSGNLVVNLISVHSPRRLTELQSWLTLLGPRQVRWIVYEEVGNVFVSKAETVVSAPASNGTFVGSGAQSFNYLLEAGKNYLFGVVVSDGDGTTAYDFEPYVENLSFAVIRGRATGIQYAPSIDATTFDDDGMITYIQTQSVAVMKATTELP
ncbi:MAG: hypothetical protein WDO74_31510 [Pseudomonadota bacterium]